MNMFVQTIVVVVMIEIGIFLYAENWSRRVYKRRV